MAGAMMLKTDYFVDQPTHTESIFDSFLGWTWSCSCRLWMVWESMMITSCSKKWLHEVVLFYISLKVHGSILLHGDVTLGRVGILGRAGKCGVSVVLAALRKGEVWRGFWSADLGFSLCSAVIRMVAHCGTTPLLGWGGRVPPMLASWFGWHLRELFIDFDLFFSSTDMLLFLVFILFVVIFTLSRCLLGGGESWSSSAFTAQATVVVLQFKGAG
jgi:hypothetical protein